MPFACSITESHRYQREQIIRHFELLSAPGEVFELRAFSTGGGAEAIGYFNDKLKLAQEALNVSNRDTAKGVFITLNPVRPELLQEAPNMVWDGQSSAAKDSDILYRRHLLIDIDPRRESGISSTDEEHERAISMGRVVKTQLTAEGWPEPILGDSGNGCGLTYRLPDMPNTAKSTAVIKAVLTALAV
jgi:hypothetical protein